jgi:hypothetical protein
MADEAGRNVVPLSDEERVREVVVQSVLGMWDAVNELTRPRPTRRERWRVGAAAPA